MSRNGHNNTATKKPNHKDQLQAINLKLLVEKLASITVEQLDHLAGTGETTLCTGVFAPDFALPPAKGQWIYRLVTTSNNKSTTAQKRLVLLPNDHRTRAIWRQGQVIVATAAGLSPQHAKIWSESSLPRRHELLKNLSIALENQQVADAYLNFGKLDKKNPGNVNIGEWITACGVKDDLTYKGRVALAAQIDELLTGVRQIEKKKAAAETVRVSPALAQLFAATEQSAAVAVAVSTQSPVMVSSPNAVDTERAQQIEFARQQLELEKDAEGNLAEPVVEAVVPVAAVLALVDEVEDIAVAVPITAPALGQSDEDLVVADTAVSSVAAAEVDSDVSTTVGAEVEGAAVVSSAD